MSDTWQHNCAGGGRPAVRPPAETDLDRQEGDETTSAHVDDLVVVSNRQPYRHQYDDDGDVTVGQPAGGLTAGLDPVMQRLEGRWLAWGDGDADREAVDDEDRVAVPPTDPQYTLERLWLGEEAVEGYYQGYCNQALWPLCHMFLDKVLFEDDHWAQYRRVNQKFADAVADGTTSDSTVWFQDYHFGLAPRLVRDQVPDDTTLMQFWHIPWPATDVFKRCPQREELLRGLLGNDLLGFHIADYGMNFLDCVDRLLEDATVDQDAGRVRYEGHTTTVRVFPLQVDADSISEMSTAADGSFARQFAREHDIEPETRMVLGVDRLDYSKGIPRRLEALERLWEEQPEWRGEFTYVQKGCVSRSGIPAYQELQQEVRDAINRINSEFGTDDWRPVVYTDEMYSRQELCALYRHADAALVSPLCDGMNLVAQEYVAAQVDDDGVLVLSEFAGANEELGEAALTVNPYDTTAFAETIEQALTMHPGVRSARMAALRQQVHDGGISAWIENVLSTANQLQHERASQ